MPEADVRRWARDEEDLVRRLIALVLGGDRSGFDNLYTDQRLNADAARRAPVVAICSFLVPIAFAGVLKRRMSFNDRNRIAATTTDPDYPFRDVVDAGYSRLLLDLASGDRTPITMGGSNAATLTSLVLAAECLRLKAGPLGWEQRYRAILLVSRRRVGVPASVPPDE